MDNRRSLIELISTSDMNHAERMKLLTDALPHGSGIDGQVRIVSRDRRKVTISTEYHHMTEHGYYDGWTSHNIVVTPCFGGGIDVRVTGRDRNDVKNYLGDVFYNALLEMYEIKWEIPADPARGEIYGRGKLMLVK